MRSTRRSAVGRGLLVALLAVPLIAVLADFWLRPSSDDVVRALALFSLPVAVLLMGVLIYRRLAAGMEGPSSVLREVPPEYRDVVRKGWRGNVDGIPSSLSGVVRRYAVAQIAEHENAALLAATFSLLWMSRGTSSTVDIVLGGLTVCFVAVGLCSAWMARRWRRLGASLASVP